MTLGRIRWRAAGYQQLQDGVREGIRDLANRWADEARAIANQHRRSGATADTIHVDDSHLNEERMAAFVATASGDGFFVHSGTNDTPPLLFFTQVVDRTSPGDVAQTIGRRIPR
jgi:hypothetical protein